MSSNENHPPDSNTRDSKTTHTHTWKKHASPIDHKTSHLVFWDDLRPLQNPGSPKSCTPCGQPPVPPTHLPPNPDFVLGYFHPTQISTLRSLPPQIYVFAKLHAYIHMYACMHECKHASMHEWVNVSMCVCTLYAVCVYVCILGHNDVCSPVFVHTHLQARVFSAMQPV